jgi:ribosome modulation factor
MDARDEGAEAYEEGKPRDANPYSMLSQKNLWTCWDDGWEEAHDENTDTDEDDGEEDSEDKEG